MDLQLLFDEERIINGPEQSRQATEEEGNEEGDKDWLITWCDTDFRRVRLFKAEAFVEKNRDSRGGKEELPLYIIIEDRYTWVGEDPRWPKESQKRRTYVTGSDSTRIRQAVGIAESYGGEVKR